MTRFRTGRTKGENHERLKGRNGIFDNDARAVYSVGGHRAYRFYPRRAEISHYADFGHHHRLVSYRGGSHIRCQNA